LFGPAAHWPEPVAVEEPVRPEPKAFVVPDPEPFVVPQPEPVAFVEPEPEPEAFVEPEPEPAPEPEAFVEPEPEPEPEPAPQALVESEPAVEAPRRRRWRRSKPEPEPEVAETLTLDANVAAFFGLTDLQAEPAPVIEQEVAQPDVAEPPVAEAIPEQPDEQLDEHVEDQADEPAPVPEPVFVAHAPLAAADDPVELIDPTSDPADLLPEDWAPPQPRTRRERKRAAKANAIPVMRAPKPVTRRRRVAKIVAVVGLICICAAVPFLVPAIPSTISDLFPDKTVSPQVADPTVDPTSGGFNGPVGVQQPGGPLAGRQLASAGSPLEVVVPRLHVDSQVIPISGQTGELLPPNDPQVLGWWQEGRGVGAESGSAVITGHTVHTGGGAFDNLGTLVPGDRIRVRTKAGWIGYVVKQSRVYATTALARNAAAIFKLDGPGRLVLITCSNFNGSIYLSNAVVYAVPVLDEPFVEAPTAKPTHHPTSGPTYVPPRIPYAPRPTRTPEVPNSGPSDNPTGVAGNTGPSGGVTPTEPPF